MYRPTYTDTVTMPLISWRSVFGGAVHALAIMVLLSSLWLALAFGSNVAFVEDNLAWYIGGTAIFSLFIGGYLAGWLSGLRGATAGIVNGLTVWGLFVLASIAVGVPSALNFVNVNLEGGFQSTAAWPTFWSLLIGFGTAFIGGLIGGSITTRRRAGIVEEDRTDIEPEARRREIA